MANHSHVPKFGNWESEQNVPYTAYFDKARKGRTGGGMINPNDPKENPDALSNHGSPARAPPSRARTEHEEPIGRGHVTPGHEHGRSRDDVFADSPSRHENMSRKTSSESIHNLQGKPVVGSGEGQRKPVRQSGVSDNSFERSPLHPNHQARMAASRGGADSPSREGRNTRDISHGTPGRSRLKPQGRGDDYPDKGATVPKFGDWDESNPAAADGFTHIFNKVREERQTGGVTAPGTGVEHSRNTGRKQDNDDKAKSCCCFPWSRK